MKLELKHLAPYLPYELKFYILHDKHSVTQKMTGLSKTDGIQTDYDKEDINGFIGNFWSLGVDERNYEFYGIKPILRPLSDLTKEIINTDCGNPIYLEMFDDADRNILELDDLFTYNDIMSISVNGYIYLLQNHFDVFNLIEKGLAIDINTLN